MTHVENPIRIRAGSSFEEALLTGMLFRFDDFSCNPRQNHIFHMQNIVIFGSSSCEPGSVEYKVASDLGRGLASSGIGIVTGGYSGTMEAASMGASQSNGVRVCTMFLNTSRSVF